MTIQPMVTPGPIGASSDQLTFRAALGRFATGVTVVTAAGAASTPIGLTVSSFNSVSLDPPLILWSLARRSSSLESLRRSPGFVVNVLAAEQSDLARQFSRGAPNKFCGVDWRPGSYGSPVLAGVLAHFECEHHAEYDGGDHVIFIGRVRDFHARSGDPLIFALGRFALPATIGSNYPRP